MGKYSKKNNKTITKRHNTTTHKNIGFNLSGLHAALDVAAVEPTTAQQTLNHELKAAPKKETKTKRRHSHGGSTKKNKNKNKRRTTRKH
jgi:hypothetical protein